MTGTLDRRSFFQAAAAAAEVTRFGAAGDGKTLATRAIQQAVDACAAKGGGVVYFPPGKYLSGTVFLKSNVRLYLDAGAVLLGSTRLADYPETPGNFRSYTDNYTNKSLIFAENVENTGIDGPGVIDGQGAAFKGPYLVRPYMLRFVSCRNVSLADVTLLDSPMWVQHYLACDGVSLRNLTVRSRVNGNNDGIDIDCSTRVRISDCDIWSGDDAIVLKSTADRPCRDVVVTNCVLSTLCNAIKLGTESNGGFSNIAVSNCTIYDTRLAGIAVECVDGGTLERVMISGVTMDKVGAPVFVRLGDRARPFLKDGPRPKMGVLRNVRIRDVIATGCSKTGCAIAGLPGHPVEDLTLEGLHLEFAGGGTQEEAVREIEEKPADYPEYKMFGTLPAYGLWFRHVRGLRLNDLRIRAAAPDARPAMSYDDVTFLSA